MSLLTWHYIDSTIFQTNSDFDAKPMVMLLGQYSTGKTTFIKHLLKTSYPGKQDGLLFLSFFSICYLRIYYTFPFASHYFLNIFKNICNVTSVGAHIGPEPTTDRFVVITVSSL